MFLPFSGVWSVAGAVLITPSCHAWILLSSVSVFTQFLFSTGIVRYECERKPQWTGLLSGTLEATITAQKKSVLNRPPLMRPSPQ